MGGGVLSVLGEGEVAQFLEQGWWAAQECLAAPGELSAMNE